MARVGMGWNGVEWVGWRGDVECSGVGGRGNSRNSCNRGHPSVSGIPNALVPLACTKAAFPFRFFPLLPPPRPSSNFLVKLHPTLVRLIDISYNVLHVYKHLASKARLRHQLSANRYSTQQWFQNLRSPGLSARKRDAGLGLGSWSQSFVDNSKAMQHGRLAMAVGPNKQAAIHGGQRQTPKAWNCGFASFVLISRPAGGITTTTRSEETEQSMPSASKRDRELQKNSKKKEGQCSMPPKRFILITPRRRSSEN